MTRYLPQAVALTIALAITNALWLSTLIPGA